MTTGTKLCEFSTENLRHLRKRSSFLRLLRARSSAVVGLNMIFIPVLVPIFCPCDCAIKREGDVSRPKIAQKESTVDACRYLLLPSEFFVAPHPTKTKLMHACAVVKKGFFDVYRARTKKGKME